MDMAVMTTDVMVVFKVMHASSEVLLCFSSDWETGCPMTCDPEDLQSKPHTYEANLPLGSLVVYKFKTVKEGVTTWFHDPTQGMASDRLQHAKGPTNNFLIVRNPAAGLARDTCGAQADKALTPGQLLLGCTPPSTLCTTVSCTLPFGNPVRVLNLTNTCFLSSAMVLLAQMQGLCSLLLSVPAPWLGGSEAARPLASQALQHYLASAAALTGGALYTPSALHRVVQLLPGFGGLRQQDAHEAISGLLAMLSGEWPSRGLSGGGPRAGVAGWATQGPCHSPQEPGLGAVGEILSGVRALHMTCQSQQCRRETLRFDSFSGLLTLPLPSSPRQPPFSLSDCMQQAFAVEDIYYTCKCGCKRATQRSMLAKMPGEVVLTLLRFGEVGGEGLEERLSRVPKITSGVTVLEGVDTAAQGLTVALRDWLLAARAEAAAGGQGWRTAKGAPFFLIDSAPQLQLLEQLVLSSSPLCCTDTPRQYSTLGFSCHSGGASGGHYWGVRSYPGTGEMGLHREFMEVNDNLPLQLLTREAVQGYEEQGLIYMVVAAEAAAAAPPPLLALQAPAAHPGDASNRLVSRLGLWQHLHGAPGRAFSSRDLMCEHGQLGWAGGEGGQAGLGVLRSVVAVTVRQLQQLQGGAAGSAWAALPHLAPCTSCREEGEALQARREEETAAVTSLQDKPPEAHFFIIAATWIRWWRAFALNRPCPEVRGDAHGRGVLPPGPISQAGLVHGEEGKLALAEDLKANERYYRLNEDTWEYLVGRYGGGPAVTLPKANQLLRGAVIVEPDMDAF